MTEETIEKMISDWYLSTPRDINELSEQLLEQHEAEMVEFAEWISRKNWYEQSIQGYWCESGAGKMDAIATTDLLTIFKNRNK